MKHGSNLISENLLAFCGGALGMFAVCFKPVLLDATGTANMGLLALIGIYAIKLLVTAIMSAVGGLGTAWGADVYKKLKEKRGKGNSGNGSQSQNDKAA